MRTYWRAQGTPLNALWQPKWEGNLKKMGYMYMYPLEEGIAAHSSVLAWRIPWTEEPGGLQTMGSRRVRHD